MAVRRAGVWRPPEHAAHLSSARDAGTAAAAAGVGRLVLTHLWPGVDPASALLAAASRYAGRIEVAVHGLRLVV